MNIKKLWTWKHFHAALTILWAVLLVPSVVWWRNSVPWLVFMSAWALVASHWAGVEADRADDRNKVLMAKLAKQLDSIENRLAELEKQIGGLYETDRAETRHKTARTTDATELSEQNRQSRSNTQG